MAALAAARHAAATRIPGVRRALSPSNGKVAFKGAASWWHGRRELQTAATRPWAVALATCELARSGLYGDAGEDDGPLVSALRRLGVAVTEVEWRRSAAALRSAGEAHKQPFDAVVLRSTWDYSDNALLRAELQSWAEDLEARGVAVYNDSAVLRWNGHKRYLRDLEAAGVAIIPSCFTWCSGGDAFDAAQLRQVAGDRGWTAVVVKPSIGGSARDVAVARLDDAAAMQRVVQVASSVLDDDGQEGVVIQRFEPTIHTAGEISVAVIDGVATHAVVKVPGAGDFRTQGEHGALEGTLPRVPTQFAQLARDVVSAAMQAVDHGAGGAQGPTGGERRWPLYARVDLVLDERDCAPVAGAATLASAASLWQSAARAGSVPLVGELELVEPSLYFSPPVIHAAVTPAAGKPGPAAGSPAPGDDGAAAMALALLRRLEGTRGD